MIWSIEEQAGAVRKRAERAMRLPLGMASPLWLAFGAAASIGVTWWWMTRWTKAVNLEGMMPAEPAFPVLSLVESAPVSEASLVPETALQIASEPLPTSIVDVAQAATAPEPKIVPEREPTATELKAAPARPPRATKPAAEPAPEPDDLTRLVGIGPKLADALAARGVTRYSQLAAWTADDLATIDAALSLKGRAVRDAWVAQARRFASAALN